MRLIFEASDFGATVREHRGAHTLREAASASGTSLATLSRLERGEVPELETLLRLCGWLGRYPAEFITQLPDYDLEPGVSYCAPCLLILREIRASGRRNV